jgi:hypothetical protein
MGASASYILPAAAGSSGQVLTLGSISGGKYPLSWGTVAGTGGAGTIPRFFSQTNAPGGTINEGDRWFDLDSGKEYVYVNDDTSSQWVQPKPTDGPVLVTGTVELNQSNLMANGSEYEIVGLEAPGAGLAWDVVSAVIRNASGSGNYSLPETTINIRHAGNGQSILTFTAASLTSGGDGWAVKAQPGVPTSNNMIANAGVEVHVEYSGAESQVGTDPEYKIFVTVHR